MRYCPYCGVELIHSEIVFCTECGKVLPVTPEEKRLEEIPKNQSDDGKSQSKEVCSNNREKQAPSREKRQKVNHAKEDSKEKIEEMPDEPKRVSQKGKKKDDYDGYYDDILPEDEGRFNEGIDRKLIKNVIILVSVVLLVVLLCVLGMYLL